VKIRPLSCYTSPVLLEAERSKIRREGGCFTEYHDKDAHRSIGLSWPGEAENGEPKRAGSRKYSKPASTMASPSPCHVSRTSFAIRSLWIPRSGPATCSN
jgi:hypothetical protein